MVFKKGFIPWNKNKHNVQTAWNKGITGYTTSDKGQKRSEITKKKISEAQKGHVTSDETKLKLRLALLGKKHSNETKLKMRNAQLGKKLTPERRKKLSLSRKLLWQNPKYREKMKYASVHRIFTFKNTSIELTLQNALKEHNISFITHKSIIGRPDIFIEPNICIFADGCYFHGCEQCLDRNKFEGWIKAKKIKDLIITQKLQNDSYIVLRFWEHEINNNIKDCVNQIKTILIEMTI